ncbi:MAG: hypothetical protein IKA87_06915 [Lentisphaeria bacterium]|nr:hypothetical protein [Lentisphaeria bacterium]
MKKLHFIGIGGAGMTPLAKLALESGAAVSGSDSADSPKSAALKSLGAGVYTGHRAEQVPEDADMVIYSSAISEDNCERKQAAALGIPQLRRGEFLGEFSRRYQRVTAISGSHGKSPITAMLTTILEQCDMDPGALIGAARNEGESAISGNGDIFVTEVDESDGTHVFVSPYLGIVPNIDGDHEWSVGGAEALEENFRTFGRNCRHLLIAGTSDLKEFFSFHPSLYEAELPDTFAGFHGFMAANAALAVRGAELLGVSRDDAIAAVSRFKGIERRMRVLNSWSDVTVIEDYAHHPTEVRASIELVRRLYPSAHLHVVFQPHRYARLERFFEDFVQVLKLADKVTVTPVFAAWTETGDVDSACLSARLPNSEYTQVSWQELAAELRKSDSGVILLLGAGDISELAALLSRR